MAHGKETPRQKMINLMYIVFIAMLALQIDQEIIKSYNDTMSSLKETRLLTQDKNGLFEQILEQKSQNSPESFGEAYRQYSELKKQINDLVEKLETAKEAMIKTSGFDDKSKNFDFNALNSTEASTHYFFVDSNEGKPTKNAKEIVGEINALREYIVTNFSKDSRMKQVVERAKKSLVTTNKDKSDWLISKFYNQPLVAALANVEIIQTEARNIESDVLANFLMEKVDANIKFNAFQAIVSAPTVIIQGEPQVAQVAIGNYSNSLNGLNITGVDRVENGMGIKTLNASNVGEQKFSGTASFTDASGKVISLPFTHTYKVIAGAKEVAFESGALLAAEKMQVLYRGLANPISGSILGADNSQTTLTASGASVSKVGNGKWMVTPGAGTSTTVTISGKGPKGQTISQSFTFRIKGLPTPVGQIRGENVVSMPASSIPNQTVSVAMPDFDWPVSFTVNSFKFKVPGKAAITVSGHSLSAVEAVAKTLKSGDICYVYDINASASGIGNQGLKKIPAVVINVQ